MNLLPILYALLAALTGLSLAPGTVEEPRVAQSSLSNAVAIARHVASVAVRGPCVAAVLRTPPVAPRALTGHALAIIRLPLESAPARRRE